jgi:hypothetical protein
MSSVPAAVPEGGTVELKFVAPGPPSLKKELADIEESLNPALTMSL